MNRVRAASGQLSSAYQNDACPCSFCTQVRRTALALKVTDRYGRADADIAPTARYDGITSRYPAEMFDTDGDVVGRAEDGSVIRRSTGLPPDVTWDISAERRDAQNRAADAAVVGWNGRTPILPLPPAQERFIDGVLASVAADGISVTKITPAEFFEPAAATAKPDRIGDAAARKAAPVASGVIDYFPDALVAIAALSKIGNEQHNPGTPLHWDRAKSGDEGDCLIRHFIDRGTLDTDGVRHSAKMAWRALALLQKEIEGER